MIRACSRCVIFIIIILVSASAMGQKAPDCPDDFKQWVRERVGPVVFPEGSSHSWGEFTQLATDLGARAVKTWVGAEKPGDALARMQSAPYRELIHRFGVVHFNISPAYIVDKYASGVIHPDSLKAIRDEWRDITRFLCRERTSADQVFLLSVGGELNVYVGTAKAYPDFPVAVYVNACHAGKQEALAEFRDSERPRVFSVAEIQGDIEYERFAQKWGPQFDTDLVSLSYYTFYLPLETSLEILTRNVTAQGPFGARRLMLGEYGPSMESCNWNQAAQVRWHDEILRQAFKQHVQFAFFYEIADHDTVIETGSHDGLIRWSPTATPRFTWAYYGDLYHQREPVLPEGDVYEHRERPLPQAQGDAPNLTLSELRAIGDVARAGHDTEFSVCVANDGHAAAKDTTVNFYVDDRIVSWVWLAGLEPGGRMVVKSTQQDPRFVWRARGGHHRVTAIVDPAERIPESNETDNVVQTEVEVDPGVESGASWEKRVLRPGMDLLDSVSGDLFDIDAEFELMDGDELGFNIRCEIVSYSAKKHAVSCLGKSAPLSPIQGRIRLPILVDRTSLEVFGNGGQVSMTSCFLPKSSDRSLEIFVKNRAVGIVSLRVYPLRPAWPRSMR